jgi:hypothetical protein
MLTKILFICWFFFVCSGCSRQYQEIEKLNCNNMSHKNIITVQHQFTWDIELIQDIKKIIWSWSICTRVNKQIKEYCMFWETHAQNIYWNIYINKTSNAILQKYINSGSYFQVIEWSIKLTQRNSQWTWNNNKCKLKTNVFDLKIEPLSSNILSKKHRNWITISIKYLKNRFITIEN